MISIEVPGYAMLRLDHIVFDFNATPAIDGRLMSGTVSRLNSIAELVEVHLLTADTFGSAAGQLRNIKCQLHVIKGRGQDIQKSEFIRELGSENTTAVGNEMNDRKMLESSRLGICLH